LERVTGIHKKGGVNVAEDYRSEYSGNARAAEGCRSEYSEIVSIGEGHMVNISD
jgi:hypothetical protein